MHVKGVLNNETGQHIADLTKEIDYSDGLLSEVSTVDFHGAQLLNANS